MINNSILPSLNLTHNVTSVLNASSNSEKINSFWAFSNAYRPIHGWLSTVVCLFGIPSNLLNIIVLTRPNMINSPTNLILTGLAFSDLLTMVSSLIFGIYFYLIHASHQLDVPSPERDTKLWTHFAKLHVMASVTFHSISIWLTVYLACFRCIYLASASSSTCGVQKASKKASDKKNISKCCSNLVYLFRRCLLQCRTYSCTLCGIINICLFCILFCFPAYIYPTVRKNLQNETTTISKNQNIVITEPRIYYTVEQSDLNIETKGLIFKIMFYTQAIFGKFVPCLLLVTFSSILIHSLVIINRNNKRLNKSINSNKSNQPKKKSCLSRLFGCVIARVAIFIPLKLKQNNDQKSKKIVTNLDDNDFEKDLNENDELNSDKNSLCQSAEKIKHNESHFSSNNTRLVELKETTDDRRKDSILTSKLKKVASEKKPKVKRNRAMENLRTTLMLTIVCILFLITEFPQSILIFFSLLMDESFYRNVYMPLGDLLDIIALINNSINFLLYCAMSRAFRNTFYKLIIDSWCFKCIKNTSPFSKENKNTLKNFDKKVKINTNNFSRFAENSVVLEYGKTCLIEENDETPLENNTKNINKHEIKLKNKSESKF